MDHDPSVMIAMMITRAKRFGITVLDRVMCIVNGQGKELMAGVKINWVRYPGALGFSAVLLQVTKLGVQISVRSWGDGVQNTQYLRGFDRGPML